MSSALEQMVSQQVRTCEVLDPATLATLRSVPREHFVPAPWRHFSHAEFAIPLAHGKRMLTPLLVGRLLQAVAVQKDAQVLEIGTGSGYVAACLASLGGRVRSLELHEDIAAQARLNLAAAGVHGVSVETADGTRLDETDRYDCVVLTAAVPSVDERYLRALKSGGRLFVVHATSGASAPMEALRIRRTDSGYDTQLLFQTSLELLEHAAVPASFRF